MERMNMAQPFLRSSLLLLVALAFLSFPAHSAQGGQADGGYYWYDGGQKRILLLDNGLVAEFGASSAAGSAVQKAAPEATVVRAKKGIATIWRVPASATAMRKAAAAKPDAKLSPVFHDGGNPAGRLRALPGNIIVYFKPEWTADMVNGWVAANQMAILQKLNIGRNAYVLKTGPGLEALTTANRIAQSGDVVSAMPDWWMEVQTR